MPLILVHSPKGGVGSTFVAAQLALHLARKGHQVSAIDFTFQDSLKLFFNMLPSQSLLDMVDTQSEALVVSGVSLANGHTLSRDPAFHDLLLQTDGTPFGGDRITIADVASDDRALKALLLPHAVLHICVLMPRPASLATLTKIEPGTPAVELKKTVFVLNHLDDRRRLSRDTHSFVRELFGPQLIGTIRRDEAVNEALAMFEPIEKFAPTSAVLPDLLALCGAVEERCGLVAPLDRLADAGRLPA